MSDIARRVNGWRDRMMEARHRDGPDAELRLSPEEYQTLMRDMEEYDKASNHASNHAVVGLTMNVVVEVPPDPMDEFWRYVQEATWRKLAGG